YASDELGSITHVTEGEEVLNRYEYDAWGNVTESQEKVENRFKFNGQQFDSISQQYYLRARYYNPVIGRFTQEDTYRGDGLNLYAYCANNPVYYVDPSGNMCETARDRIIESMDKGTATAKEQGNLAAYLRNKVNKGEKLIPAEQEAAKKLNIDIANKGSGTSRIEVVDSDAGTFRITDWSEYPDEYVPLPDKNKEWVLLEGDKYESARKQANEINKNIRKGDSYYSDNRLEIHEVEPVKFGGSPTDLTNKTAIQGQAHRKYVTPWWNKIRDEAKKGLNK
ncbi:RHS repeat-associated core domain-containing protein, partial [Anaerocolumna jejuensis DSM 15929]